MVAACRPLPRRITFPIGTKAEKSSRWLPALGDDQPKYLNSLSADLFESNLLYHWTERREALRRSDFAYWS